MVDWNIVTIKKKKKKYKGGLIMGDLNLSNNEKRYDLYAIEEICDNVFDENKESISRVFEDICNDNKDGVRYDLYAIEDQMWEYALSDLCYEEQEYMKLLFENFKKGV